MTKAYSPFDLQKMPVTGLVPESSATAPASPRDGQLWYDTATPALRIYDQANGLWRLIYDARMPVGSDEVAVSTTAPTNVGGFPEVWVDLTAGPPSGGAMVVIMTQAAYTALAVKDANTVYVVT